MIKKWKVVKVIAKEGMQVGIVSDADGELVLICKQPHEEWPHGLQPTISVNQIAAGQKVYEVIYEKDGSYAWTSDTIDVG